MVLNVQGLTKSFRDPLTLKKEIVLNDVSFEVGPSSVVGFLGLNGAGKTTAIKCLVRLLSCDQGQISFFDNPKWTNAEKSRIGYLPERPYFYEYLTGDEFLSFYASLARVSPSREEISSLFKKVGLSHARKLALRNYSKGMLQRIGLAQALVHDPDLFILDEPMAGLDPDGRKEVLDIIRQIKKREKAIFFSSHLLDDVEKICDHLVIIDKGTIIYTGTLPDFINKFQIGWEVSYTDGKEINKQEFDELSGVQTNIDLLRKDKKEIIGVKKRTMDLENAFYKFRQTVHNDEAR